MLSVTARRVMQNLSPLARGLSGTISQRHLVCKQMEGLLMRFTQTVSLALAWFIRHLFCSSPLIISRLWNLDFQIKCKIYFHLKRGDFGPLSNRPVLFLLSPGRTLLM